MSSQTFTWNGYESELVGPLPSGSTSVQLLSTVGLQAPGYLVIDPDVTNPSVREWIRFNTINGDTLENLVRGLAGSVGPTNVGSDHIAGAKIRAVFTKQNLDDLFADILENTSDLSGAGGHIPDSGDPHSAAGYIKLTTADQRYVNVTGDTMAGILSMNSFKITNLLAGTVSGDAINWDQWQAAIFSGDHADLTNVLTDQHHTKYTDGEAVGAMGALNVNNPLNHDRYDDADAVSAMGALDDANDLNHNRYTDANAVSAMGAKGDSNDLNHDKYTDTDALDANLNQHILVRAAQGTPPTNPGGSMTTAVSTSIDIPNTWGAYKVLVRGEAQYANNVDNAALEARITINGGAGPQVQSGQTGPSGVCVASPADYDDSETADPCVVTLQVSDDGTTPLNIGKYANIDVMIARVS